MKGEIELSLLRSFLGSNLYRESPESAALIILSLLWGHPMLTDVLAHLDEFYDILLAGEDALTLKPRADQKAASFIASLKAYRP